MADETKAQGLSDLPAWAEWWPLKGVHALIPETRDCVTLCGRGNSADVIKSRIFTWRDYPALSRGPNVITTVLVRGNRQIKAEVMYFKDGGGHHEPRNIGSP